MRTLTHIRTGRKYQETDIIGHWPDRSEKTAMDEANRNPKEWSIGSNDSFKSEVFELAKNLLLAFAQGGVDAPAEDCINKAKEMIKLREELSWEV